MLIGLSRMATCALLLTLGLTTARPVFAQEVNLYTTREPGLMKPLMDGFTKATGIKVNSIFVKDGLAERVAAEGAQSPADVLMTVDIGNLIDVVEKGLDAAGAVPGVREGRPGESPRQGRASGSRCPLRARVLYAAKGSQADGVHV